MAILALVFAIAGAVIVCLGFAAFIPEVGRILGYVSFAGWPFLIAGLVLSIVALVRRAQATGLSVSALIVSIVGGVFGIVAGVIVAVAGVLSVTMTVIDEFGDLVPEQDSGYSMPEGSGDFDVLADCAAVIAADPGRAGGQGSIPELLDGLAAEVTTDEVREPLEDLSAAYDAMAEADGPDETSDAEAELDRAAAELGTVCGIDLDELG